MIGEARPPAAAAFRAGKKIASGELGEVALAVHAALRADPAVPVLVFDALTGEVVDLNLEGSEDEVARRYSPPPLEPRRGRPRLGVVAREVTLLPRHWDWIARQPGGASVTLRKLVDAARRSSREASQGRERQEAAYRFMSAVAGDLPGFEAAARALFAKEETGLARAMALWPPDVADEVCRLLALRPSVE